MKGKPKPKTWGVVDDRLLRHFIVARFTDEERTPMTIFMYGVINRIDRGTGLFHVRFLDGDTLKYAISEWGKLHDDAEMAKTTPDRMDKEISEYDIKHKISV